MSSTNDQQTTTGWIIFIAALGMMCGMLAVDIAGLQEWADATTPTFVGTMIGHASAVIAAFVGGKIIPESRGHSERRFDDDLPPAA